MRIHWMALIAAALAVVPAQAQSFWSCPGNFEGKTLNVYNWTTYIAEDTISNFERICGVSVVYNTYATDTDMVDELLAGGTGYDVVVPSNSSVAVMIEEGMLLPPERAHIPNFTNLGTRFVDPPYDPGSVYSIPYQWGTLSVGYNVTRTGEIDSWDDVFNYAGPVAWIDEYRAMLGFALLMLGGDPNTTDQGQIDAAAQYLMAHSANVVTIAPDSGQDLLASGEVDIAIEYSGDIYQLIASCGCDDFRYVIPTEGAQIWTDSLVIPASAQDFRLAEAFIDYILYPQTGADISNYTAYASPNQRAIDEGLIYLDYLDDKAIYPDQDILRRLFFNTGSTSVEQMYAAAWDRVTAAVGR